jgi:thiol-disulfide isomerase/thioredoxin
VPVREEVAGLADYGRAPDFQGISHWLNSRPLTLSSLRGKVVLVDFWTYSCINCLRTLPHLEAWYRAYHRLGLEIVGVHTPEFQFEHVLTNVRHNARDLGVRYPVALDNRYSTWNAYHNEYWPAEYLIDRRGRLRHFHFGEGEYEHTERLIRKLLGARGPDTRTPDSTPTGFLTPETYLGYARLANYGGSMAGAEGGHFSRYVLPAHLDENRVAYGGVWLVDKERIVAGKNAVVQLRFRARDVYLVAGGRGTVQALVDGRRTRTVRIDGSRLYAVVTGKRIRTALLELHFTRGLSAYSFTFG